MAGQGECPDCGHAHDPGAKFCSECGARLTVERARETRKTVTAVFADLVGSTPLQERIDAESAHHVMGRFYATMRGALEAHGGHVAKFIGDAVVGLFGFPTVREDDALRAVRAACVMRDALAPLNEELHRDWGVQIGMRVGVNTGEVVISPEGLAIGDTMNVAARLEQAAPAGEVLIGEPTWRHVRHAVRCEEIPPLVLKGKRDPVPAFRLLDAPSSGQQRVRIMAPLVGRDAELGRLVGAFEDAVGAGACRLVSVIGSPGIGKTRLAEELAGALGDRASVVLGRCEPTGEGITFLPVVEVLRGAAEIGEADSAEVVRDKLAGLVAGDPDRDLLVERAAGIMGLAPPASPEETFWSVRRLLGGLARRRPLVVVLDDVHWGQPTFLDLIAHLAEWGRESPILLLALARPELRELRPAFSEPGRLTHDVIELAPLGNEHSRELVDELLDRADVPEVLALRVLATTGGNPLFVGEMLRMLVDDGVLRRDDAGWVTAGDASDVEVPPTISALLAARIERLGADERSVVERASVIGKQFYRGAVASLSSAPVAAGIDSHLESLQRKEVVEPDGTVWADEAVFRFHHVLIRDAAYRTLLKEARAELHERFADWLETKVGELVGEHEEVIAFHLEQAHSYRRELGPLDERGRGLGERAVARLHSAGRRALAREDLPAASNLLRRAADSAGSAVDGDLLVDLLEALLSAGDTAYVSTVVSQLREVAGRDPRLSAWAAVADAQLTHLTDSTGLHGTLGQVATAGEALAAAGDDRGLAKAHHVRAQGLGLLGRVGDVEAALDEALAAARRAGDARRVTAVLSGAPRAALWGPSPVMRASGRCLDVVRILRMSQGNRHVEAVALRCQAVLEAMRGRADAARQILDRCRMTLEELGLGMELLETEQYAGIVELIVGDDEAAERRLRAAYDGFAQRRLGVGAATAAALLARALLGQDRDDEAEELTRFSETHAGEHLQPTIAWCGVRAQVLARRGEFAEAEHFARRAVDIAAGTDALVDHGDARMALADVLRAAGREDEAAGEARRAAELYEEKGHEVGAARAARFAGERFAPPMAAAPAFSPTPIDEGGFGRLVHLSCTAFDRRDWAGLRALMSPDIDVFDRRPASPRGDAHGADAFIEPGLAIVEVSADVRTPCMVVVDAGALGIAHIVATGHETDSGSEFAIPMVWVIRIVDARMDRIEFFNPEDERAAYDRLLDLQPDPAVRVAWRQQLDVLAAVNAGEAAGALAPDVEVVDHRSSRVDRAGFLALLGSHTTMKLELLDAAGDAAVMSRIHLVGADGDPDLVLGQVTSLRDGVAVRVELFEPTDEPGMRACLERLAAGRTTEPTTPRAVLSTALQRHFDELTAAANQSDWTVVASFYALDFLAVDRRTLATFGEIAGRDAFVEYARGLPALGRDAVYSFEQFAGDDRVGALHAALSGHMADGGGEFTLAISSATRAGEDGVERFEYFDADDETRAAERMLELQPDELVRAAWRPQLDVVIAIDARDWSRLEATFAEGVVLVDHRDERSAERRGRAAVVEFVRSLLYGMPDGRAAIHFLDTGEGVAMSRLHLYGQEEEITLGLVVALHDGQIARIELFDPRDENRMRACVERLASGHAVGEVALAPPRAVMRTVLQRHFDDVSGTANRRDWAAFAQTAAPRFHAVDRRSPSMFGEVHGRDAYVKYTQGLTALASDAVYSSAQFAGDDRVGLTFVSATGHLDDGGGEFTYETVLTSSVGEEGLEHVAYFDVHDEISAIEGLLALHPDVEVRAAWKPQLDVVTAINRRDWSLLEAAFAEGVVLVDHRGERSAERRGRAAAVGLVRSLLDPIPDCRAAIQFLDSIQGVGMSRLHVYGSDAEVAIGQVLAIHDGQIARIELFDPDDESGSHSCFEQLTGDQAVAEVALAPPRVVMATAWQRRVDDFIEAINRRDWAAFTRILAPGFYAVDRRTPSTFGEIEGTDAYAEYVQGLPSLAKDAFAAMAQFAGDDCVGAFHAEWTGHLDDGGGEFTYGAIFANTQGAEGWDRAEYFDVGDETSGVEGLLALQPDAGVRAAWKPQLDVLTAINARDWPRLEAVFSEGVVLVDHRDERSAERRGRPAVVGFVRSLLDAMPDGRAAIHFLDSGQSVAMSRMHLYGAETDTAIDLVIALRDGQITRLELFDSGAEAPMRARYESLLSDRAGEASSSAGPVSTLFGRFLDCVNARDFEGAGRSCASDMVVVDHRPVSPLGERRDRNEFLDHFPALIALASDARIVYEPLGEVGPVGIHRGCWVGHMDESGGAFETPWRGIAVARDGAIVHGEIFDVDDEAGALRAWCRLAGGGDGGPGPATALVPRLLAAVNGRSWDELHALSTPEFTTVDHRRAVGQGFAGEESMVGRAEALADVSRDSGYEIEPLAEIDGIVMVIHRITGHFDDGGGPFEIHSRGVYASRGGRITRYEIFDEDDEAGMLGAVARLRAEPQLGPAARVMQRHADCVNDRDFEGFRECFAAEFTGVDRRPISLRGRLSRDEAVAVSQELTASSSDARFELDHIAEMDGVWFGSGAWTGHMDETGGAFELPMRAVVCCRDGLMVRGEIFDAGDEAGALRALCRLVGGSDGASGPASTVVHRLEEALVARDWDRVQACFGADLETVDHRRVTALGFDHPGGAGFAERSRGLVAVASDAHPTVEVLAEIDGMLMVIIAWSGHLDEGGGPFELRWRGVVAARDDAAVRYELFDEDDESGMLAAVARLRATAPPPRRNRITELYEVFCEGFRARDWDLMTSRWAEDLVMANRRPASGWPVLRGRAEAEPFVQNMLTMSPDMDHFFEIVEGDDECAIVRWSARGHATAADGGGVLEIAEMQIAVARDDRLSYLEMYPPDADIEMLRARREKLRPLAHRRPGTDLPIEPLPTEHLVTKLNRHLDASDWESASAMLAADVTVVDHRQVSTWAGDDRGSFLAQWRSVSEISTDLVSRVEVVAATEHGVAGIYTARGQMRPADGGGPFEIVAGILWHAPAGLIERVELFDPDDEAGLLARFAELGRG